VLKSILQGCDEATNFGRVNLVEFTELRIDVCARVPLLPALRAALELRELEDLADVQCNTGPRGPLFGTSLVEEGTRAVKCVREP
jgi:hypothetical protein